jgi:hypothetical protein
MQSTINHSNLCLMYITLYFFTYSQNEYTQVDIEKYIDGYPVSIYAVLSQIVKQLRLNANYKMQAYIYAFIKNMLYKMITLK